MLEIAALVAGVLYGFIFGIIPVAGPATALIALYGFMGFFHTHPYLLVIFTTATVVSCAIGDNFSSIVMNIPGSGGSAATMVDGFPLTKKGQGARALSAATVTSTVNGALWGIAVFVFLPYYATLITAFGIPEMLALTLVALVCVVFINSHYWFRGMIALALGIFMGLIGHDATNTPRFTFGWYYLEDGLQIAPVLAGFLAFPELVEAMWARTTKVAVPKDQVWPQIWQGFKDSWRYKWDGLRGGLIGGLIGLLPGVGGSMVDWLAYSQTVVMNRNDPIPFGEGNMRGVVGCEGANNAQKATAYVPTVLFGVPAAPFEAVVMALYMYVGLEMGSPMLLADQKFFSSLSFGYLAGLALTFLLSIAFIRYAIAFTRVRPVYYIVPVMVLIAWSCAQYTGGWEDYAILGVCCVLGMICKYCKLSRAALIIGFVLAERIESIGLQYMSIYAPLDILHRPIAVVLLIIGAAAMIYGLFFNKAKINYV